MKRPSIKKLFYFPPKSFVQIKFFLNFKYMSLWNFMGKTIEKDILINTENISSTLKNEAESLLQQNEQNPLTSEEMDILVFLLIN